MIRQLVGFRGDPPRASTSPSRLVAMSAPLTGGYRRVVAAGGAPLARGRRAGRAASDTLSHVADRIRPRPLRDGAVVGVLCAVTLAMLAVSVTLAFAFSAWLRTSSGDVLLAAAAAVTVGVLFLVVMFLVFAAKDGGVRRDRASHLGTTIATDTPTVSRLTKDQAVERDQDVADAA